MFNGETFGHSAGDIPVLRCHTGKKGKGGFHVSKDQEKGGKGESNRAKGPKKARGTGEPRQIAQERCRTITSRDAKLLGDTGLKDLREVHLLE